jgi:hypothetical protein
MSAKGTKGERDRNGNLQVDGGQRDPQWEGFKYYIRKIAAVAKEEPNELLAKREREEKEKRLG